jgi:hypothetical protein
MSSLLLLNSDTSRSQSFLSRRVNPAKRNHSSFTLVYLLCAGENLPLFADADEGCQWEVQNDEG